jgi:all-trans-retinol dehydrogenase (NAD+)
MTTARTPPLQVLTAPTRLVLFDPRVTGPLLLAILYHPDRLRSILPSGLHPLIESPRFIKLLKACLGLVLICKLNNKLSELTANNFKRNARFVKSQELVLISGGSSGIGELMAKDFAKVGVKVVVLDLSPPKEPLRKPAPSLHFWSLFPPLTKPSSERVLLPS